jgi:hypothetical protein
MKQPNLSLKTKTRMKEMAKTRELPEEEVVEETTEVEVNIDLEEPTSKTEKTRMKMDSKQLRRTTRPTTEVEAEEVEEEALMKEEAVTTKKEATEEEVAIEEIEVKEVTEVKEVIEAVEQDQPLPEKERSSPKVNKFLKLKPKPNQPPLSKLLRSEESNIDVLELNSLVEA